MKHNKTFMGVTHQNSTITYRYIHFGYEKAASKAGETCQRFPVFLVLCRIFVPMPYLADSGISVTFPIGASLAVYVTYSFSSRLKEKDRQFLPGISFFI